MRGRRIAQYEVLDTLGAGGMGTVYRARVVEGRHGLEPGRVVALKVVHPQLLEQPGFFKRFLREAEVGGKVVHENVVRTLDCDALVIDGRQQHFLVMELVEGQTLRGLLDELGKVPEELCRHIGREVAEGLAAIHGAGVVHRDLKPENVLITKDHAVKIMDLGVAHLQDAAIRLSRTGAFLGSIEYAAPEQFRHRDEGVDARADLHALGVTLYELSTGRHPFRADDAHATLHNVLEGEIRPAGALNPDLSPFFEEVLRTLTARDPDQRFASAGVLRDVLAKGEQSAWWLERQATVPRREDLPLQRLRLPRETALYGREDAMARLEAAWRTACSGEGRVVLVQGEAGIGKTRLVDEFVASLRGKGEEVHFLYGSYPPGGAATAAGAFSTAYREHFGVAGLERKLASYLSTTPLLVPAFAALLQGDARPDGSEPLTRDSLQTVFVHVTRALAEERPTIVLIDDLHFAPEEGRALFSALASAVPGHPVLLIGTMRRGVSPSWIASTTRLDHVFPLVLTRLGPKDLARLLEEAFQSRRLAKELHHLVSVKSDGNPFFAFEIIRGLREGNFITLGRDGTWSSTGEIREIEVPSSVLDLVEARTSALSEKERDLLDVASCCGFEFDPCLVSDAVGVARILSLKRFAQIERHHRLLRAVGHRYAFDHHQVQEALYGRLMPQLRREYHTLLGAAYEAQDATPPDGAACVEICDHHLRGSRPERAQPYLARALAHLEEGYLNEAAIGLAERALAVEGLVSDAERVRLLVRKSKRLDLLGRRAEEQAALKEALAIAESLGDAVLVGRVLCRLGGSYRLAGRAEDAERALRRAVGLACEARDVSAEAEAVWGLANALGGQGRYPEAREAMERSVALETSLGKEVETTRRLSGLAAMLHTMGERDEAKTLFARALDLSIRGGDRQGEVLARGNIALVLAGAGQVEEARLHLERALELAREIGDRAGEAHLEGTLGNLAYNEGRLEDARDHHLQNLALSREMNSPMGEAIATGNLGNVCYALGRCAEALEHYERTLALARESRDRYIEILCLTAQGELDVLLGARRRARERLETAERLAREANTPGPRAGALRHLAELEAACGNPDAAGERIAEALDLFETMDVPEQMAAALLVRGRLREAAGDVESARDDFTRALALARSVEHAGKTIRAIGRLLLLGEGEAAAAVAEYREQASRASVAARVEGAWLLWCATRDRAHLEEAHRLLVHLREHAPEEDRSSMVDDVPLHRAIQEAWTAEGPATPAPASR